MPRSCLAHLKREMAPMMIQRTGRRRRKPFWSAPQAGAAEGDTSCCAQGLPQLSSPKSLSGHCHHLILLKLRAQKLGLAKKCSAAERGHMS